MAESITAITSICQILPNNIKIENLLNFSGVFCMLTIQCYICCRVLWMVWEFCILTLYQYMLGIKWAGTRDLKASQRWWADSSRSHQSETCWYGGTLVWLLAQIHNGTEVTLSTSYITAMINHREITESVFYCLWTWVWLKHEWTGGFCTMIRQK